MIQKTLSFKYSIFLICFSQVILGNHENLITKVDDYLKEPKENNTLLKLILEFGSVQGFFTSDEVEGIFNHLQKTYS